MEAEAPYSDLAVPSRRKWYMFLWKRYRGRPSDRQAECIIERWLQRRQSARDIIEPQIEGKPTTSAHQGTTPLTSDCPIRTEERIRGDEKQYEAPSTSATRSANEVKQPRSIMRSVSAKSKASTVRFTVPEKHREREPEKLSYLARFKRFCGNPNCRTIMCVIFGILLPCFFIYLILWCLYRSMKTRRMLVRGRLNS